MTAKHVAMIPARLSSKRVPRKNLRFLGDRPLLAWVVDTALSCGLFDAVYVNTESDVIAQLAERCGAEVYRRTSDLASDDATSDDFVDDFMQAVPCEFVTQLLPTCPFVTADDIRRAHQLTSSFDTVVSVEVVRAECYRDDGAAINFDPCVAMKPSQQLAPVYVMRNGVFVWRSSSFIYNRRQFSAAAYGGYSAGKVPLWGRSTVDIDTEEDFAYAESLLSVQPVAPRYWTPTYACDSSYVKVMTDDGVANCARTSAAVCRDVLSSVASMVPGSAVRIIDSPDYCVTLIKQAPGDGNRAHYHPACDEWWMIIDGAYEFTVAGKVAIACFGDVVFVPRGVVHQIRAVGDAPATRMAVSKSNAIHVYHD